MRFINTLYGLTLGAVVALYWVGKAPSRFHGIAIPDIAMLIFTVLALIGLVATLCEHYKFNRAEILFALFLVLVPLPGLFADVVLNVRASSDWSNFIGINALEAGPSYLSGVRSYWTVAIVFLFPSRVIGSAITKSTFLWSFGIAIFLHLLWGVGQVLYIFVPQYLEALPIQVGVACDGGLCLNIVRAVGLTSDSFAFSYLFLVAALVFALLGNHRFVSTMAVMASWLSVSRSFILASMPFLLNNTSQFDKAKRLATWFVIICVVLIAWSGVADLLERRFEGDLSVETRWATNVLALRELFSGKVFGIGFSHPYYTDSTVAYLLLSSGIFGVIFYLVAWSCFFFGLWRVSKSRNEVVWFGIGFLIVSFLVGAAEGQPGVFVLFVLYWFLRIRAVRPRQVPRVGPGTPACR